MTIALNLVVARLVIASNFPDEVPYLLVSTSLFIDAAFIPAPASYTLALAVIAALSFVLATVLTYALVPDAQTFWVRRGGTVAFRDYLVLGTTNIGILGFIALFISRTLYSLSRTAHEAERLRNYLVEEQLGAGGMGQVYRTLHALIRRPTALKVIKTTGDEEQAALVLVTSRWPTLLRQGSGLRTG